MSATSGRGLFAAGLCLLALLPARSPRQPSLGRATWYQSLLHRCNPKNFDYGAWIERRRRALLEASLRQPGFWYGVTMTGSSLLLMCLCGKLWLDNRRRMRMTEEMIADLYNHDLYSRETARQAIEKYNHHMERCNQAVEAAESGGLCRWGEPAADHLREELRRVARELEATGQERNKLQEELRQKSLAVADLSARLDRLAPKGNGAEPTARAEPAATPVDRSADSARLFHEINRLQEELYIERQKNRRWKGG
jgi:hypothetical protein